MGRRQVAFLFVFASLGDSIEKQVVAASVNGCMMEASMVDLCLRFLIWEKVEDDGVVVRYWS